METLGDRLRLARQKKGFKQTDVKERTKINNKTLSGYENNVSEPDITTLTELAELYEVSLEWLSTGRVDVKLDGKLLNPPSKDELDIAKKLESILGDLDSANSLAFNGEPMDDNTRDLVRAQIESNLRVAKEMARKKFTPKKFRNDNND